MKLFSNIVFLVSVTSVIVKAIDPVDMEERDLSTDYDESISEEFYDPETYYDSSEDDSLDLVERKRSSSKKTKTVTVTTTVTERPTCSSSTGSTGSSGSTSGVKLPSQIIDLKNWYLTLPVGSAGKPRLVKQPELSSFSMNPFFYGVDNSVIFTAPCNGYTTPNSKYPRSELREMTGSALASWTASSGTHTLTVDHAVIHLPVVKPEVCIAQIHDSKSDVVEILVVGKTVQAMIFGKRDPAYMLDPNYVLGTRIKTKIHVEMGIINIFYNDMGKPKIQVKYTGSGNYFKVGAYTQSNPSKGDAPTAYSQVQVFSAVVSHG